MEVRYGDSNHRDVPGFHGSGYGNARRKRCHRSRTGLDDFFEDEALAWTPPGRAPSLMRRAIMMKLDIAAEAGDRFGCFLF